MLVRFDAWRPGIASLGLDAAAGVCDGVEHGLQVVSGVFECQEAAGEDRLEGALGVGSIGAGSGVGRFGFGAEQLVEVVGQDLGGEVLLKGEIGQPTGGLEAQAMLDPLEGLLDPPAAVIERPELLGRVAPGVEQVGHQHADVAAGGDVANQAHRARCGLDLIDRGLGRAWRRQGHHLLRGARAQEVRDAAPAPGIGAQAKAQPPLRQRRHHRVADIAAVEHQQIAAGIELIQCLEQHLALRTVGRVQARVQGQLGTGQKQREGVVVGGQAGIRAGRDAQPGGIGRHDPQTIPARRIDLWLRQRQQVLARKSKDVRRKPASGLVERLRADFPTANRHTLQLTEQGIEFGLHAGTHPGNHHRRDPRQGQVAITGKSAWTQPHSINQGGVEKKPGKLIQQRYAIECLSS